MNAIAYILHIPQSACCIDCRINNSCIRMANTEEIWFQSRHRCVAHTCACTFRSIGNALWAAFCKSCIFKVSCANLLSAFLHVVRSILGIYVDKYCAAFRECWSSPVQLASPWKLQLCVDQAAFWSWVPSNWLRSYECGWMQRVLSDIS